MYAISFCFVDFQKRSNDEGFGSDDDLIDESRPRNNLETQDVQGPTIVGQSRKRARKASVFIVRTLPEDLRRRWLNLFDLFVVDFFFSDGLRSTTDIENTIISLWRKEFVEDEGDENAMPSAPQIQAV
jgi:hypothetical protein